MENQQNTYSIMTHEFFDFETWTSSESEELPKSIELCVILSAGDTQLDAGNIQLFENCNIPTIMVKGILFLMWDVDLGPIRKLSEKSLVLILAVDSKLLKVKVMQITDY